MEKVPTRTRRLYHALLNDNVELIMDDEKYFTLPNEPLSTNCGFYISDPSTTPSDVRFKRTQKYPAKFLVWIAISEKGISKPFFPKQTQAINERTFLMPLVNSYHKVGNVLLWPDLASSHYVVSVTDFFEEQKIRRIVLRHALLKEFGKF
ncbi:unnamed protein product [Rotaria socialis]|uniref:Transposase n=1 Tax=Rotaria socialis TaxID=392032 RepID=A0A817WLA8_9BILA|nr:unnamed protein product [Rotaria socialis]